MTESEWSTCTDPTPMLEFLRGKASERKLRLFAVACCRAVWPLLTDVRSQRAVEVSEQFADGLVSEDELAKANYYAESAYFRATNVVDQKRREQKLIQGGFLDPEDALVDKPIDYLQAVEDASHAAELATCDTSSFLEYAHQSLLLRELVEDIFANPFRPPILSPTWLTPDLLAIAQSVYEHRAFHRVFAVADALADAGAPDDSEILRHLRAAGPHVRGCWALDMILGKN